MSNKLEQLQFKLEKNIGIQKHAGKVRKYLFLDQKRTKIKWQSSRSNDWDMVQLQ